MNTLIIGLILVFGGEKVDTNAVNTNAKDYSWVLEEMNNPIDYFDEMEFADSKIKIYDLEGNVVGQYDQSYFIENRLPLSELRIIQDSDFLFEFKGDSYYLLD